MKVLSSLDALASIEFQEPIACAIGVYDGVHLGHQTMIKHLHKQTSSKGSRVIITFSPHPGEILQAQPVPLVHSLAHRLHLLEHYGIDAVFVLPFTEELAAESYCDFLSALHTELPFSSLVFGKGDALGYKRLGTEPRICELGTKLHFTPYYLKKETYHRQTISSGFIKKTILERDLKKIKKLLGRPYSIWTSYPSSKPIQDSEALFKWSMQCPNLCPLPSGVYAVDLEHASGKFAAIAFVSSTLNLYQVPTLHLDLLFPTLPPEKSAYLHIIFIDYLHDAINVKALETSFFLKNPLLNRACQPT